MAAESSTSLPHSPPASVNGTLPTNRPPPPQLSAPPPSLSPPPPTRDLSPPPPAVHPPPPPPPSLSPPPPTRDLSPPPPAVHPPPPPSLNPPPPTPLPPYSVSPPHTNKAPELPSSPEYPVRTPAPPDSPTSLNFAPNLSPPPVVGQVFPPPFTGPRTFLSPSPPSTGTQGVLSTKDGNSHTTGRGGVSTGAAVAIGTVSGLVLLGIFGIAVLCAWNRKKKGSGHKSAGSRHEPDFALPVMQKPPVGSGFEKGIAISHRGLVSLGHHKIVFTYGELFEATNGFCAENLLGEGGFGSVYKGRLGDGRDVAVKQLKPGGQQGEREFEAEVRTISRIHHRYLVSIVGYCTHEYKRLLVYDYLPNNTLYFHLQGKGVPALDWTKRVKIALGAARGIAYLHEDCDPRIIHRDIKSSNILLDNNFEARVSDFGLAKLAMDANTHVTTRVMGTFGYMAPEYASTGKLTEKSDVYSYGVMLLELITGRKPVDSFQCAGEDSLVEWARRSLNKALETEDFTEVADPRLQGKYDTVEMYKMVEVAAACVRHSSTNRPKMGLVVRALDSIDNADLSNGMKVGESQMFDWAQQSAELRFFQKMAFDNHEFDSQFFNNSNLSSSDADGNPQSIQISPS